MSRIYFHSEAGTVEVLGSERAWLGSLSDDVGLSTVDAHNLRALGEWMTVSLGGRAPADFRLNSELLDIARLYVRYGSDDQTLSYRGSALPVWDISLNTALRLGSDPVKLAARIHAQCEIHGWVDGPNRGWLAGIITEGLESGAFRSPGERDPGWQGVIEFLTAKDDQPVVMSYSVCDSFPNAQASDWMPPWPEGVPKDWRALTEAQQAERSRRAEDWDELPADEQWRRGMAYLRASTDFLELEPDGFHDFIFGLNGLTWLDLEAGEARLREVLELAEA